ncbi:MAG: arsenosugar biosynthesis arsenite methyltransferase ArsM [Xanthobacteraceae bacterium]
MSLADSYLETTRELYKQAAVEPQQGLCCTTSPVWQLPELNIPPRMRSMNYGCGSTVNPRDLAGSPTILYVGVGGGMEVLQFSYFSRRAGAVVGLDVVDEMLAACRDNLASAEAMNPWFRRNFVDLRKGDALDLPLADASVDIAAQNCLFNIFNDGELERALREMYRVLKPHGKLLLSDPVCDAEIPAMLRNDARLRAMCLTGALPLAVYLRRLADIGFGTVEVRARRPYRVLSPRHYDTDRLIAVESVEICAIKDPVPNDGPCVFTGRTAIYHGPDEVFDDRRGHVLRQNQPANVCDKTANVLAALGRDDIFISGSTWHYDGGGCC